MKTLKELAELVEDKERELAYGSETSVLSEFVYKYDCTGRILDERPGEEITDEEYQNWIDAYDAIS